MKRLVLMILLILFSVNLAYAYRMEIWVKRPDYAVTERYSASQDYSGQQGYRNWYYQYKSGNSYYNMGGYGSCWQGSSGIWAQPPNTCCLCLWRDGGHPGLSEEVVRTWIAPHSGTIYISGSAGDNDAGGGNGVYLYVRNTNDKNVWSYDMPNGQARFNFGFFTTVGTNDYIRFAISSKYNDPYYDTTYFNPTIEYVNGVELAKECTSSNPNFECVVTYSCAEKPTGTYSAQARTFDNNNNYASESGWISLSCNPPPQVISVTPSSGLYYNTNTLTFRTVYRDEAGAKDIQKVYFAISPPNYGNDPSGNNEEAYCKSFEGNLSYYFGAVYYPSSRTFNVASIDTGGCPWSNTNTNKLGTAKLLTVSHTTSGNDLIVDWTIQFTNFDTGDKNLYLMVEDSLSQGNAAGSGLVWEKKGQITFYGFVSSTTPLPPGQTTTTIQGGNGGKCYSDADCPCYANCINTQCVDFRQYLKGCNYFDNCRGDSNCCDRNGCNPNYCVNAEEGICEDEYYVCHGFISNCGVST
jgi:hypothetical protein